MKKLKILTKPTQISARDLRDFGYEDLDMQWESKAERLQGRQWRRLRQELA